MQYDSGLIEEKWRDVWKRTDLYRTRQDMSQDKFYVLDMFPYPSGEGLHVGHPKGYIATDIIARKKMMEGKNVLHPMGMDAFGLPAENYALANKIHPSAAVEKNIERFKAQLDKLGFTYDWEREVRTTDPAFYKWTQWAFVKMFEKGLAYESFEPINWCPSCKTGLANEDLEDGRCERCGSIVEKKPLRQWVLKITDYADRLLDDLQQLDWPEAIKEAQRNWIGRSEGFEIDFSVADSDEKISVFTTRPDTLFGVTYVVLSPEHALASQLKERIENFEAVERYQEAAKKKTEIERTGSKEKTGVPLQGVFALNPVNNEKIPVWVADYVLADYGTGAVMAVPAHDERDFEFAKKYELPIRQVIAPETGIVEKNEVPVKGVCAVIYDPETEKFAVPEWEGGLFGLYSGGLEAGETVEEGIKREVLEESGLHDFKSMEYLWSTRSHYFNNAKQIFRVADVTCFLVILNSRDEKLTQREAHEKFSSGWRTAEELIENWEAKNQHHDYDHWIDFVKRSVNRLQEQNIVKGEKLFSVEPFCAEGFVCNSGEFNGLDSATAKSKIAEFAQARTVTKYKLRDWVFSRQRYWGEPIPLIHCEKCGVVAVPEDQLPVVLPQVDSYEPSGTGESPLATIDDWVNVACPKCGGAGKRETNTMPQWAGSSWYYLRYIDPNNDKALVDPAKEKYWSPVDVYVGGAEHATRHLIYARFWHKFLYDIGAVSHLEPFKRYTNLGLILAEDGRKMSKRWGNVVNPDDMVARYGADAFRLYEMFIGPFTQAAAFKESGVAATKSFLNRIWLLAEKMTASGADNSKLETLLHQTIKKVGDDIEDFKFNTAVSSLMILSNAYAEAGNISRAAYEVVLKLLAPFAPHMTEELWHEYNYAASPEDSIFASDWPGYDSALLVNETAMIAVQVNGKLRDTFEIATDLDDDAVKNEALRLPNVAKWLDGKEVKKIIVVKNKLVSIVI